MKLKRLEIKNIASIEHANIDFEKEPLADSNVILITGDFGCHLFGSLRHHTAYDQLRDGWRMEGKRC